MFNVSAAAERRAPDWLSTRRHDAAARLTDLQLPTAEEEVWRYSRIGDLDLDAFHPLTESSPDPAPPAVVDELLSGLGEFAGVVVLRDGAIVRSELHPEWVERGVTFGSLADSPAGEVTFGSVSDVPTDVFAELNTALSIDPVLLDVPAGVLVDQPFVVVDWITTSGVATFPRLVVRLGEQAQASIVDWHGSDDVVAFSSPVIELDAGQAAHLGYVNVQDRGPQVWQIASQVSQVGRDATLVAAQAALGGEYARTRADCRLVGRGATGNLMAVYFGERAQTLDFRTFQDHAAPDTTSNLLFKGAVADHSRSVYTGLIKVRKEGRGTNAFQTNRNIKLSEHAWAESVPNLEIENNDVRCSHASTVGPIDGEQRFYLESRGVPTATAERLIVGGFFEEVLDRLPVPGLEGLLTYEIDERLQRVEQVSA